MIDATFEVEDWVEEPVDDGTPKLTTANVTKRFDGDVVGSSRLTYVMAYGDDGSAVTTAIERIEATIGERRGTLVVRHVGAYADGAATADLEVLADLGGGDFVDVGGSGTMRADPQGTMRLDLDLD